MSREGPAGLGSGRFLLIGGSAASLIFSMDLARGPEAVSVVLLLVSEAGWRGEVVILDIERPHFSCTELEEELGEGRGCELAMETEFDLGV